MVEGLITTNFGNIKIKLFPDVTPETVRHFMTLAKSIFYAVILFHRVLPACMIQCGDSKTKKAVKNTWGIGDPGYNIKDKFKSRSHIRGIVSMARSSDPDSAGSQFFIVTSDSTFLDKEYTVFGEVIEGMDAADKIVNLPRDSNDCPLQEAKMLQLTISE